MRIKRYKMSVNCSPSIRSRLALLVVGCLLPALTMAVLLLSYDYYQARTQLVRDSTATARAMASIVDGQLADITSSLHSLATSPYLTSNDLAAFYSQTKEVLRHQVGDNIVLSDLSGKQYINTLRPYGGMLPQRNAIVPMKKMAETGKPMISDLFVGPVFGRPAIAVGVPVIRDGKCIYGLSTGIFANHFDKILQRQNLPSGWIGVIFDGSGTIIARTPEIEYLIGKKGSQNLIARISAAKEGAFEGRSLEGVPVLTVFSHSVNSNWTVAISIPSKSLTDALWRTFSWLVLAAAVLFAISLGMAWWLGGRIARSVRGLAAPALALGSGAAVVVPLLNLREADEVGASLVKASEMLHQARHQANHDALTGLSNHSLFKEIVDQQLTLCHRSKSYLSVLYIDLDGFKIINDRHGHAAGDRILRTVAERLKAGIRESDVAARLGGDEFAVLLVNAAMEEAVAVASKLIDSLSVSYVLDELTVDISASIGVAEFPSSGTTSTALLHCADGAMYEAKALGKRRVAVATCQIRV